MPQGQLIFALDVSSKVNQFGAYAGLAAIVGLGVLSLLYFAQARELKRLRDWAGRAPERAAETVAPVAPGPQQAQRLAPHPQAQRTTVSPAQPITPAPVRPSPTAPASAAAAAAAASAATQGSSAPASAGAPGAPPVSAGTSGTAAAAAQGPPAKPAPGTPGAPAQGTPATPALGAAAASAAPGTEPVPSAPGSSPAAPATPARVTPASAAALSQPTVASRPVTPHDSASASASAPSPGPATVPRQAGRPTTPLRAPGQPGGAPYQPASARARSDAERELGVKGGSPLKTTLLVVGGVVLVAVVVFVLVTQVFGASDDAPAPNTIQTTASTTSTATATPKKKAKPGTPTVVRANTTVTVLNGTQTGGLAMTETNKLKQAGFKTGTPADAVDQSAATSYVYFADGKRPAADEVAGALGLSADSVRALDASTKVLAPGADVVVVVGADQAG